MIDTTREMIAGYVAVALLVAGYIGTLWLRARRVRDRRAMLASRGERASPTR